MATLYLVRAVFVLPPLHVLHARWHSLNALTAYMISMDHSIGAELACQDTILWEAYANHAILLA